MDSPGRRIPKRHFVLPAFVGVASVTLAILLWGGDPDAGTPRPAPALALALLEPLGQVDEMRLFRWLGEAPPGGRSAPNARAMGSEAADYGCFGAEERAGV